MAIGLVLGGVVAIGLGPDRLRRAWAALLLVGGLAHCLRRPAHAVSRVHRQRRRRAPPTSRPAVRRARAARRWGPLRSGWSVRCSTAASGSALPLATRSVAPWRSASCSPRRGAGGSGRRGGQPDRLRDGALRRVPKPGDDRARRKPPHVRRRPASRPLARGSGRVLASSPLTGVGEGSYPFGYYEERRTDRNLSTPHSAVFSVIAELGAGRGRCACSCSWLALARRLRRSLAARAIRCRALVGLGAARRRGRGLRTGHRRLDLADPGDRRHLLPAGGPRARDACGASPRAAVRAGCSLAPRLVLAPRCSPCSRCSRRRSYVGDVYVRKARATDAARAASALESARDGRAVPARGRRCRSTCRPERTRTSGRRAAARDDLREALDLEPDNFVTYALLGDLEVRAGNERRARCPVPARAALNPRDVGLRKLSRGEFGS